MKAFDLINSICGNGLDNNMMIVCEYQDETYLCEYFGKQYHIKHKCSRIIEGDKLLAVWSTNSGRSRIAGDPDVILEADQNDRIYLYTK